MIERANAINRYENGWSSGVFVETPFETFFLFFLYKNSRILLKTVHFSTAECSNIYCQNFYFRDPRIQNFVGGASLEPLRGKHLPISWIRHWNGYNYMYYSSFSKSWFLLLSADHMHHIILNLTHKYYLSKQEYLVDLTMQSQPTLFFLMLKDLFPHHKLPITLGVKQKLGTNLNLYINTPFTRHKIFGIVIRIGRSGSRSRSRVAFTRQRHFDQDQDPDRDRNRKPEFLPA